MRKKAMSLLPVIILALLVSCDGSGSDSSEGANFSTVSASASFDLGVYEADVAVWEDTNDDDLCDTPFYFADDATITIDSHTNQNLHSTLTACDLVLVAYTVEFTPLEADSPAVPSKTKYHHLVVPAGGSATGPIRIIDQEDKMVLSHPLNHSDYILFFNGGTGVQYEYTVAVTMSLNELCTGITQRLKVQFPLYYYDIADDCN